MPEPLRSTTEAISFRRARGQGVQGLGGFVLLLALLLGACGGNGDTALSVAEALERTPAYRLATGDEVRITVFDHPDLSGTYEIDNTGEITFPLLSRVEAAGLTAAALRERVQDRLNARYLVDARATVEILDYRPVYVLGEVNDPGSYAYQPGLSVYQAIAAAGGFSRRAVTDRVTLLRQADGETRRLDVPKSAPIRPGDIIEVDRRLF